MKIILSTIPSDSHMWNLVFMQLYLEELGADVSNLGICTPIKFLVEEAKIIKPDMIVISTINGHATHGGPLVVKAIKSDPLLKNTTLVIGGKLGIKSDDIKIVKKLYNAGFDEVYTDGGEYEPLYEFTSRFFPSKINTKSMIA